VRALKAAVEALQVNPGDLVPHLAGVLSAAVDLALLVDPLLASVLSSPTQAIDSLAVAPPLLAIAPLPPEVQAICRASSKAMKTLRGTEPATRASSVVPLISRTEATADGRGTCTDGGVVAVHRPRVV
jgi:hypothetical protein